MVRKVRELGRTRYVGDSATNLVHDTWHADCQGCGLDETLRKGHAVVFEPDTLDGALWAGYEYCEACHDTTEPVPPGWAGAEAARPKGERKQGMGMPASRSAGPDSGREALRREAFGSQRETTKVAG
jgi:hypothetical protein